MNRWYDRLIPHLVFGITTGLVLFGLVMVYSSSAFYDYRKNSRHEWEEAVEKAVQTATFEVGHQDSSDDAIRMLSALRKRDAERRTSMLSTFLRQARWVFLGFFFLAIAARIDYPIWEKKIGWVVLAFLSCQVLLILIPPDTGLPIQSRVVNGARSSIQIFSFRFQPSEFAKVGLILYAARVLSRWIDAKNRPFLRLIPGFVITGISLSIILWESDKGVVGHICIALVTLWVLAGIRFRYIFTASLVMGAVLTVLILSDPEAFSRFFDNFQVRQAKAAFARGGAFGTGLGDGDADLANLYGAHTDFIMAVVGEELGFAATSTVVFGYLALVLLGFRIADSCPDPFGTFLALGITVLLGTQAFLNIAVATGIAPTTGFTLPLLSYGGSSLIWTMASIGILINISLSSPKHLLGNSKSAQGMFSPVEGVV